MLRDEPSQRNPRNAGTGDAPPPQNISELLGQVRDAIGLFRHRSFAVTRQVVTQQAEAIGQGRGEIPEPVIDAEAMQQHQRRTGARGVNSNVPPVQRAHAQAPRFLIGLSAMLYKLAAAIQPNPCATMPR